MNELSVHSGSAHPTVAAPCRSKGGRKAGCRQPANACLVDVSCLVVQTAVWGELGNFVWHKALKLTKDYRAGL